MTGSRLINRYPEEWQAATAHPFLVAVRDGTLPRGVFAGWLQQDYLFVNDLLRWQARLVAEAPRSAQEVLAGGLVALESELRWFEARAAAWGVNLDGPCHATTRAYVVTLQRLLLEPFEVGMTALWGLERVYLEAWRGAAPGSSEYREFVEHWTVADFAGYVKALEVHSSDSPAAEAAWLQIVRLERQFWDMALAAE